MIQSIHSFMSPDEAIIPTCLKQGFNCETSIQIVPKSHEHSLLPSPLWPFDARVEDCLKQQAAFRS